MSGNLDRVMDRVRKLLALAKSTNQHEAANAAAQAARLMEEYEIEEAQIRVEDATAPAEPIETSTMQKGERRLDEWRRVLASGCAEGLGAYAWYRGADIMIMGRRSAVQSATYMYQYLASEIGRLADEQYEYVRGHISEHGRSWKTSFRLGAAHIVFRRLREQRAEHMGRAEHAQQTQYDPCANTAALVLVKKDAEEVDAAWKKASAKFTNHRFGGPSSGGGYNAGREAGAAISLGGARPAIGAPARRIRGG